MKCSHCQVEIHTNFNSEQIGPGWLGKENGQDIYWETKYMVCPACERALITVRQRNNNKYLGEWSIHPRFATRPPAPSEVPADIAEDFNEAAAVLGISAKASAALSRRCLQGLLRDQGYTHHDLAPAIQAALNSNTLPAAHAENLDAVRNIGNFAAHPMKDKQTDAIMPVEPHEAEWNLEVLEGLFDHYYVQPAKAAARRAALDAKLGAAGKPAMKTPATQP